MISESRTNTQPVFDIIGERAEKLCDADVSLVSILDGDSIQLVALHGENPEGTALVRRRFPMLLNAETVTARTVRSRAVVHIEDMLVDPTYETKDEALRAGFRSGLGVPMLREGRVVGVIFVSRRTPGLFTTSQVELLKTFADQAVIAIENVRLFTELEARTRELTRSVGELKALGEVGQAISSTLELETVLATIVSRATALAGMDGGAIFEYDEASEAFPYDRSFTRRSCRGPWRSTDPERGRSDRRARAQGRAGADPRHYGRGKLSKSGPGDTCAAGLPVAARSAFATRRPLARRAGRHPQDGG